MAARAKKFVMSHSMEKTWVWFCCPDIQVNVGSINRKNMVQTGLGKK
jgi:hypothetical protein